MDETKLLERITVNPKIFGGKPIIRGHRSAVEHVLGMLAAGDSPETILEGYPWLQPEDIQACLVYPVSKQTLPRFLDDLPSRNIPGRTKEEIDRYLQEERESW